MKQWSHSGTSGLHGYDNIHSLNYMLCTLYLFVYNWLIFVLNKNMFNILSDNRVLQK